MNATQGTIADGTRRAGLPRAGDDEVGSDMALSSAVNRAQVSTNAVALRLASDMREELLTIVREMLEQSTVAGRLAYSPDEAAELLGISRELIHDLLRTRSSAQSRRGGAG